MGKSNISNSDGGNQQSDSDSFRGLNEKQLKKVKKHIHASIARLELFLRGEETVDGDDIRLVLALLYALKKVFPILQEVYTEHKDQQAQLNFITIYGNIVEDLNKFPDPNPPSVAGTNWQPTQLDYTTGGEYQYDDHSSDEVSKFSLTDEEVSKI